MNLRFTPQTARSVRRPAAAPLVAGRLGRWSLAGGMLGAAIGLVAVAPAAWLAAAVQQATQGRFQLAQAEGSLWRGSALPVLAGSAGTADASVLPSRLHWTTRLRLDGLHVEFTQSCCIASAIALHMQGLWQPPAIHLRPTQGSQWGQWPAAWFEGLGAPLNTLRPQGQVQISGDGLDWTAPAGAGGPWQMNGQIRLDLLHTSSRMSPVEPLGSYRLTISGQDGNAPALKLSTLDGALVLDAQGQIGPHGVSLRGDAKAAEGFEAALNNLLNIVGRRDGAVSHISIG